MIVSWNWLTDYVRLDMPVEVLTERLALTGLNHRSRLATSAATSPSTWRSRATGPIAWATWASPARSRCSSTSRCACPTPGRATSGAPVETRTSVTVEEPDLCPRFTARVVSGVKVGESPWWLRKRLETIGVRPISNVVDVTNYVMFECGQPLHAYDLDRLAERRLVVRRARPGETLTAINNKVYELTPEMLVDRRRRASGRPGGRHGRARHRDRPGTTQRPDRGRAVRRDVRPPDLAGAGPVQPVELPVRAAARSRGDRMGQPPLRRADPGGRRRHAPSGRDRRRPAQPPERPAITLRLDQIERILGIAIDRATAARILTALGLEPLARGPTPR